MADAFVQERAYIEQLSPYHYRINPGFVPNMRVPGVFYVNQRLEDLLFEELQVYCQRADHGGFLPAVKQIANVAALPGIVKVCAPAAAHGPRFPAAWMSVNCPHTLAVTLQASVALPDVHSGYGFAIGNVAAFDMDDPEAVGEAMCRPRHSMQPH